MSRNQRQNEFLSPRCLQPICNREYHHTADNFHQRNLMEQFYRGAKARSCFHIGWPSASPRSVFFHLPQTFCIATSIIPPQQPTECFFHLPLPFALLPPAFRCAQQPTKYTNDRMMNNITLKIATTRHSVFMYCATPALQESQS